jgi:hypothetical protein
VFYSRSDGGLLEPLIRQYIGELKAAADVHIVTLHLRTRRDLLWSRILDRLTREPSRAALREDQAEWMDAVLSFYDRMRWDVTVPNDEISMPSLVGDIFARLADMEAGVGDAIAASPIVKSHMAAMATPICEAPAAGAGVECDDVPISGMGALVTPMKAKPARSTTAASASTVYSGSASTSPASEAGSEASAALRASPASLSARASGGDGIAVSLALPVSCDVSPLAATSCGAGGAMTARSAPANGKEVAPAPPAQWLVGEAGTA